MGIDHAFATELHKAAEPLHDASRALRGCL